MSSKELLINIIRFGIHIGSANFASAQCNGLQFIKMAMEERASFLICSISISIEERVSLINTWIVSLSSMH